MKIFVFSWHLKETFEDEKKSQEGSPPSISDTSPPDQKCNSVDDPSWSSMVIDSRLFRERIVLARKEAYKAARSENPGLPVYVYPSEWEPLQNVNDDDLVRLHLLKKETEGFILGPDHPEVKALEAQKWFSAFEPKSSGHKKYVCHLDPYEESITLRESLAEELRRKREKN